MEYNASLCINKLPLWSEGNGQLCRIYKDVEITHHAQDCLELKCALQRRGLAMHMAHLVSFGSHEKLVDCYFEEMARDSVDQMRYERISLDQLANMDREIFICIGEKPETVSAHWVTSRPKNSRLIRS